MPEKCKYEETVPGCANGIWDWRCDHTSNRSQNEPPMEQSGAIYLPMITQHTKKCAPAQNQAGPFCPRRRASTLGGQAGVIPWLIKVTLSSSLLIENLIRNM